MAQKVTFHWSNYYKPTPPNVRRWVENLQAIWVSITGVAAYQAAFDSWPWWAPLVSHAFDAMLTRLSGFLAKLEQDYTKIQTKTEITETTEVTTVEKK